MSTHRLRQPRTMQQHRRKHRPLHRRHRIYPAPTMVRKWTRRTTFKNRRRHRRRHRENPVNNRGNIIINNSCRRENSVINRNRSNNKNRHRRLDVNSVTVNNRCLNIRHFIKISRNNNNFNLRGEKRAIHVKIALPYSEPIIFRKTKISFPAAARLGCNNNVRLHRRRRHSANNVAARA